MTLEGVVGYPEEFARRYRELGLWRGVPLGDAFAEQAARFGTRVAVVDGDRRVTYAELFELADRLAGHLVERELCRGARVVFQLPNVMEFVVAYVACVRVGAIPIACIPSHRHTEISACARLAEAAAWFGAAELRGFDYLQMVEKVRADVPSLSEVWTVGAAGGATASFDELLRRPSRVSDAAIRDARPAGSDVAILQLSGGTTGLSKLVPRTHDNYLCNARTGGVVKSLGADDVVLVALPIAHNFALASGVQSALLVGARIVLAPSPSADVVLPLIERERVTWVSAVPAMLLQWMEAARKRAFDLSCLRVIYVGGQRLGEDPARAAMKIFGPVIRQAYGMAEGLNFMTRADDPPDVHARYQGRLMTPACEARVVDDEGDEVPPGVVGELQGRGPTVIRGYFRAPEHNRTAFTDDGFYCTGDLVCIDASGNVSIEGRRKDVINRGGEKFGAEELENLLLAHPAIRAAAVVAVPDPVYGERACACVVLREGHSLGLPEVAAYLRGCEIASFKIPERLEILDEMPLTHIGKVSKKALRERFS